MTKGIPLIATVVGLAIASPAIPESKAATASDAQKAYLAAINSNDLEQFLQTVTEDVVLMAPDAPALQGKAAVAPWVSAYFDAYQTSWSKRSLEFVEASDWAFERYEFRVIDVPYAAGLTTVATGVGVNIYNRGPDGTWRVARDIWSNDSRITVVEPICGKSSGPC